MLQRNSPPPSPQQKSALLNKLSTERKIVVEQYIQDVEFDKEMSLALSHVFQHNTVDQTPYYTILDHFRRIELQHTIIPENNWTKPTIEIMEEGVMTCVLPERTLWGLPHLLLNINANAIQRILALFKSTHGMPPDSIWIEEEYDIHTFLTFMGKSVFYGSFYPFMNEWNCEQHYLMTGPKFEKAINLFVRHIMKDVYDAQLSGMILVEGIYITIPGRKTKHHKSKMETHLWTIDDMKTRRMAFVSAVKTATVANRGCFVKSLYRVVSSGRKGTSLTYTKYVPCYKQYVLHHRKDAKINYRSFIPDPSKCLREGLFFTEAAALAYANVATLKWETTSYISDVVEADAKGNHRDTFEKFLYFIVMQKEAKYFNLMAPISELLRHIPSELYALECEAETMMEVLYFFQRLVSSGIDLNQNKVPNKRGDMTSDENMVNYATVVSDQFEQYSYALKRIMNMKRMSAITGLETFVHYQLDVLQQAFPSEVTSLRPLVGIHNPLSYIMDAFKNLQSVCSVLDLTISRDIALLASMVAKEPNLENNHKKTDAEEYSHNIIVMLNELCSSFEDGAGEASKTKRKEFENGVHFHVEPVDLPQHYIHLEREARKSLVRQEYPPVVLTECVKLRYLVDSRLDSALESAMSEVLTSALLPNPYPSIVSSLSIHSVRHDYWKTPNAEVLAVVSNYKNAVDPYDPDTGIQYADGPRMHRIDVSPSTPGGINAIFGCPHLLTYCHAVAVATIREELAELIGFHYGSMGTAYSITVIPALLGRTLGQGALLANMPMHHLDIVENIFVEGKQQSRGIEFLSEAVLYNALHLLELKGVYVRHIGMGEGAEEWSTPCKLVYSIHSLKSKRDSFKLDVQRAVRNRDIIVLVGFVLHNDKYVTFCKYYNFHFTLLPLTEVESFASASIAWSHLSLLFSPKHVKRMLTIPHVPFRIEAQRLQSEIDGYKAQGDYYHVHELTLYGLIHNEDADAQASLSNSLRLFYSASLEWIMVEQVCTRLMGIMDWYLESSDEGKKKQLKWSILEMEMGILYGNTMQILDRRGWWHARGVDHYLQRLMTDHLDNLGHKEDISKKTRAGIENILGIVRILRLIFTHDFHQNCQPPSVTTFPKLEPQQNKE